MLRHWVVAVRSPRTTSHDAFRGKLERFSKRVFLKSLQSIARTGGFESATAGKMRRDGKSVESDQPDCNPTPHAFNARGGLFRLFLMVGCQGCLVFLNGTSLESPVLLVTMSKALQPVHTLGGKHRHRLPVASQLAMPAFARAERMFAFNTSYGTLLIDFRATNAMSYPSTGPCKSKHAARILRLARFRQTAFPSFFPAIKATRPSRSC